MRRIKHRCNMHSHAKTALPLGLTAPAECFALVNAIDLALKAEKRAGQVTGIVKKPAKVLPRFVRPKTREGIRPARKLRSSSRLLETQVNTRNGEEQLESRPIASEECSLRLQFAPTRFDGATFDVAGFKTDRGEWVQCAEACREFRRACKRLGVTQTHCERVMGKNRNGQTATAQNSFYCVGTVAALESLAKLPGVVEMILKRTSQAPRFSTTLAPEATAKLVTESPLTSMPLFDENGKVKFEEVKGKQEVKTVTHRATPIDKLTHGPKVIGTLPATPRKHAPETIAARNAANAVADDKLDTLAMRARQLADARQSPAYFMARVVCRSMAECGIGQPMAVAVAFAGQFHQ